MSPYRTPDQPEPPVCEREACPDGDLVPVFLLSWVACLLRTGFAVAADDTLGADASLAVIGLVLIPSLLKSSLAWCWKALVRRF